MIAKKINSPDFARMRRMGFKWSNPSVGITLQTNIAIFDISEIRSKNVSQGIAFVLESGTFTLETLGSRATYPTDSFGIEASAVNDIIATAGAGILGFFIQLGKLTDGSTILWVDTLVMTATGIKRKGDGGGGGGATPARIPAP